jgi:hypothetical protein
MPVLHVLVLQFSIMMVYSNNKNRSWQPLQWCGMVWACSASRCFITQPKLLPVPFACLGCCTYMLGSHSTNGNLLPTCMGGVVLRCRNQSQWTSWSMAKTLTKNAGWTSVSLPIPRRKSYLGPLKICALLGRDPVRPNSKTVTTDVRVSKVVNALHSTHN